MNLRNIITITFMLLCVLSHAQIATIDSKKIVASIPEMAKLDTLVVQESEKYAKVLGEKNALAQQDYRVADSLYRVKPKDQTTKKAIEKANASQKDFQNYQTLANQKVVELKNLLYKPYLEKINSVILAVATRKKIMQVLDIQQVSMVFYSPLGDITDEVIKELKTKK